MGPLLLVDLGSFLGLLVSKPATHQFVTIWLPFCAIFAADFAFGGSSYVDLWVPQPHTASIWVLHSCLLRLPVKDRCVIAAAHLLLQTVSLIRQPTSPSLADVFATGSIVLLGGALGVAILRLESLVVDSRVGLALAELTREHVKLKRESSAELAQLAPVIRWERVELLHQIGLGAFGSVHAARYLGTLAVGAYAY